jgi:hypothetical protein
MEKGKRKGIPGGPRRSRATRADAVGVGPHISERRGGNGVERATGGGGGGGAGARAGAGAEAALRHGGR